MAQFYGDLQGDRGAVTRAGSKSSGIDAHVRGWNVGVRVQVDHIDGKDVVRVYRTSGSNGHEPDDMLAEFDEDGLR